MAGISGYINRGKLVAVVGALLAVIVTGCGASGGGGGTAVVPAKRSNPAVGGIYVYSGLWKGQTAQLTPVANRSVENLGDAKLDGQLASFQTDDPAYACLNGQPLNVWTAPKEFPGEYVVRNDGQGTQCAYGTWTIAVGAAKGNLILRVAASPNPVSTAGQVITITTTLSQPVNDGTVILTGTGPSGALPPFTSCTPAGGVCTFVWNPPWDTGANGNWSFSADWSGDGQDNPAYGYLSVGIKVWGAS